ncbi:MAG: hypothetical protein GX348_02905 [Veillonellaceae bacterium]|jgi:hypothetical protein|nr:hypothetical protein [Veillonellaceae bacterium]
MGKKAIWAILTVCLVLSASLLTWCYFQVDVPRKSPVRAKQVFNINAGDSGRLEFNIAFLE